MLFVCIWCDKKVYLILGYMEHEIYAGLYNISFDRSVPTHGSNFVITLPVNFKKGIGPLANTVRSITRTIVSLRGFISCLWLRTRLVNPTTSLKINQISTSLLVLTPRACVAKEVLRCVKCDKFLCTHLCGKAWLIQLVTNFYHTHCLEYTTWIASGKGTGKPGVQAKRE